MDYLIVTVLIAEVATLSWADRRIFGTWLTPFNLLSFPYTAVAVLAFFLAPALGFVSLYSPSVVIWEVGLFCFWAVGALMGWGFFGGVRNMCPFAGAELPGFREAFSTKLAMRLSWAILPLLAYGLYESQRESGGWAQLGSYDFRVEYSRGLGSHAVVLAMALSIYLMGTWKKGRKLQLLTIGTLLFFLFASQVKGTLLAPLIAAMIFRAARGDLKLSVRKLAAGVGVSYVAFNAVYLLGISLAAPQALTDSQVYTGLARHYLYYMWAGVLSFGEALRSGVGWIGGPWTDIFSPFLNLYRAFFHAGPLVVAGSPRSLGMNIDLTVAGFQGVNVYTMFGTLYFYLGAFAGILVVVGIAVMIYGLLLICRLRDNLWLLTLYCALVSWLVLAFFEYYFMYLTFLEVAAYCSILSLVASKRAAARGLSAFRPGSNLAIGGGGNLGSRA